MSDLSKYNLTIDDLPKWMHPKRRRLDWAFIIIFALALIIFSPLYVNSGIPDMPSAQAEAYRIQAMADSFNDGHLYPRWVWQFNQETGSPIFNYLAPAPHWLAGLYQVLTQSTATASLRYFLIVCSILGTLSTLFFIRQRWTSGAGISAALLYMTSPFVLSSAPYWQVDSGIMLATALVPFNLWILDRLWIHNRGLDFILFGLGMTGLMLAENGLGVVLVCFILLWLIYQMVVEQKHKNLRSIVGAITLAGTMSLIFFIPAINQLDEAGWIDTQPELIAETSHFYSPPWEIDKSNASVPPFYLGLASSLGGFLACGWWIGLSIHEKRLFFSNYFLMAIFIGLAILLRSQTQSIWSPFYQIEPLTSQDMFGLFNFVAVVLTGVTVNNIRLKLSRQSYQYIFIGIIGILIISNGAYVHIPQFSTQNEVKLTDYAEWESESGWYGMLPNGRVVVSKGERIQPLTDSFAKFADNYPENSLIEVEQSTQYRELFIYSPNANRLILQVNNYPGLQMRLNDKAVSITRDPITSESSIPLRAGENQLVLDFVNTPLYWWSLGASVLAVLMLMLIGYSLEHDAWQD